MRTPALFRHQCAFTLVELLVVIGIIALLISILLPALSRAKEQASRVKCLSNLKQLATATMMYTQDNQGWFPRGADSGNGDDDWIFWQTGRDRNKGAIVRFLGRSFVEGHYVCPSDDPIAHPRYPYSYTMNEFMGGLRPIATNPDLHLRIKTSQVRRASEKILFIDESAATDIDGCWAPQHYPLDMMNLLSNRHDRRAEAKSDPNAGNGTVVFCDGHADLIPRKRSTEAAWYDPDL